MRAKNLPKKPKLTIPRLRREARKFAEIESAHAEPALFGVTDGKAIGTYLEHKFQAHLQEIYTCELGNSAKGIDFPSLDVDLKTTSIKQPQSSSPFKSARQKIYGLGYSLLLLVYEKNDNAQTQTGNLRIRHTIFVSAMRTGDFQTTTGILKILDNEGNEDDLIAFMQERMLPVDEIEASNLARELLINPPTVGYLTISNALQWRLQYKRVIDEAGKTSGIYRVR